MTDFPPFRLDSENQCLWRDTERITLTPKAFFLLQYLVERAGRLVTHSELLESLWPNSFVQPEVLKTQILDIRHALGDDARAPRFIETQPRRGYRFIAPIENAAASEPVSRPGPEASIAVLPFVNLGGARQNEYFGDGLAEDVINELAKIPGLKVIARTSAFAFKGRTQDIRRIAEVLGVANVLEGSFRSEGDRLRIVAQLISASDGNHLWSGRFDRAFTDVLTIQDEIAQAIADALRTKLRGPGERRPSSSEAYRAYLEGRYFVQQVTPQAIDHALQCYERAIKLDPGYALPHSGLALQAYYRVLYLAQRPNELAPAALASLGRALQLDPESAQSHVVRGVFSAFYEYNWNDADDHFVKALQMDPASPMVRVARALWFLVPTRRLPEALAEIKIGVTLDPFSPAVRISELWVLYTLRTPEAVDKARSLIRLFPSLPICRFVAGLTLLRNNLIDEAATTVEAGLSVAPGDVFLLGVMALVRSRQGRIADVDNIRNELDRRASERYIPFLPRSFIAEASGDCALSHQLLDQAVNEREPLAVIALADQCGDEVRRPGSDSLLRKMNLV